LVVIAAGCNTKNQTEPNTPQNPKANAIMNEFQALTQKDTSPEEVADFINNNIADVSKENAAKMVDEFERIQIKFLPQFERIIFKADMQNKINNEYNSITEQSDIKDTELKELITKTQNSGYKVETAEGMYFPVIDYEFYKNFSAHVTTDMKDYIDIMAVESNHVPAKDAALVISWDEIVKRTLNQDDFIETHSDSIKIDEIKQLHQKYVTFTLYGANNTPLFSYDAKTIDPEAKDAYLSAVANGGNSKFIKTLEGFLDVVKNNNYRLTNQVEQYRTDVSKKYTTALSSSNSEPQNDAQATLLNDIEQLAQQGKVINCEFAVETTVIDTVKEQWGDADKEDYIPDAKGTYATYAKHNVDFGFNKGSQIFDVRSYDYRLKEITMSKVKEVLGTPENTHQFETEDMLVYQVGEQYQLLFIFPKSTEENSAPQLDHYNVFYPRGTVNSMADDPGIKY